MTENIMVLCSVCMLNRWKVASRQAMCLRSRMNHDVSHYFVKGKKSQGKLNEISSERAAQRCFFPLDEWNSLAFGVVGISKRSRDKERQIEGGKGNRQALIAWMLVQNQYYEEVTNNMRLVYLSFLKRLFLHTNTKNIKSFNSSNKTNNYKKK